MCNPHDALYLIRESSFFSKSTCHTCNKMHRQPPIFIFFWYLGYDITNRKAPDLKIVGLDIPHPEEVYTHLELCIYIYIYIKNVSFFILM